MTHDEARLLIGAAPGEVGPPLAEHLAQCPQCTEFRQQMVQMDRDLTRLLTAPLPPRAAARVVPLPVVSRPVPTRVPRGMGLMALAASVVVSVGMGVLFWTLRPQPTLAAGVVQHISQEPGSWSEVAPMTASATAQVLTGAGVTLDPQDTTVTYARSCLFNRHWVPHLVVRTANGPVTVLVLHDEHVSGRQSFRQNGYSGVLLPGPGGGTVAVIAQGTTADLDELTSTIDSHVHWTP